VWIGFIWLRTETCNRFSWTWQWTFEFHKRQWISWLAEHTITFSRRTLLNGVSYHSTQLSYRMNTQRPNQKTHIHMWWKLFYFISLKCIWILMCQQLNLQFPVPMKSLQFHDGELNSLPESSTNFLRIFIYTFQSVTLLSMDEPL
jgi:hypothetical protein